MSISSTTDGLLFGIYPGSGVGLDAGSGLIEGKPDDPEKIKAALIDLAGDQPFLVRGYIQYVGGGIGKFLTPPGIRSYCHDNLHLDLALCYHSNDNDMENWQHFVRQTIAEYQDILVKVPFSGGGLESSGNGFQFGLMRDDYSPKPAYHVFKNLIEKYH